MGRRDVGEGVVPAAPGCGILHVGGDEFGLDRIKHAGVPELERVVRAGEDEVPEIFPGATLDRKPRELLTGRHRGLRQFDVRKRLRPFPREEIAMGRARRDDDDDLALLLGGGDELVPLLIAAALCERLQDVHRGMTLDDLLRWAGATIEQYNQCAARHKALSEWAR